MAWRFLVFIALVAAIFLGKETSIQAESIQAETVAPSESLERVSPKLAQASAEDYAKRGSVKAESGDYQGAIAAYTEAIRLNPEFYEAYFRRARIKFFNLEDKQGAIADCDEAIRLNPNYGVAYGLRGFVKADLGDDKGSIPDFTESIRLAPQYADAAYSNRGLAKSNLGDKQGAIADFTGSILANPNYANAYYNRGDIYQQIGEKQKAIADFRKASELYQQQGKTEMYNLSLNKITEIGG